MAEINPKEEKVSHSSGATSSHFSPFNFYPTYEGMKLTALRFKAGNHKHENNNPVYPEANWLKAYYAKDIEFFRDRAGHALEHLVDEMRGKDDNDPGGNLGAIGWFVDVMGFVKKNDPEFYARIQGKSPKSCPDDNQANRPALEDIAREREKDTEVPYSARGYRFRGERCAGHYFCEHKLSANACCRASTYGKIVDDQAHKAIQHGLPAFFCRQHVPIAVDMKDA